MESSFEAHYKRDERSDNFFVYDINLNIGIDYILKEETIECEFFYYVYKLESESIHEKQRFPVTSILPKDLGKLAQNIFKWIKEQMKKILD